jgi:ribosomal-protein-alanine N-acetyltransferase
MNADPRVMEFFPNPYSREESAAGVDRIQSHFDQYDYGLWAVTIEGVADFAGFVGICNTSGAVPFSPCVEVGWRLAAEHWGQGYATEGAQAALDFGFSRLGLDEIVSYTAVTNKRSRRVMAKLGMTHDTAGDFDHPSVAVGHPLRRHVLYRTQRASGRSTGTLPGAV